jgi:hypothetical protein
MPTSTLTLDSAAVPAVASTTPPDVSTIAVDGGSAPASETIATGSGASALIQTMNDHAARIDIATGGLVGIPSILKGLGLTSTSGLVVNVAAGQAVIGGLIEIAAKTVTVNDSATSRIWLTQAGAVVAGTGAYVPSGSAIYLGSVVASGGVVTTIDTSGVFTLVGGIPVRTTADTFKVSTAPSAGTPVHITKTTGGRWLWDGTRYNLLVGESAIGSLSTSATTSQIVTYLRDLGLATA